MLRAALPRAAAAASCQRLLPAVAAAGLHHAAWLAQQVAEAAPARMEEAAQAVKEVMGEPDPLVVQHLQAQAEPLPLAALRFDDPKAAFKVGARQACPAWPPDPVGGLQAASPHASNTHRIHPVHSHHCLPQILTSMPPCPSSSLLLPRAARPSPAWTSCAPCWSSSSARCRPWCGTRTACWPGASACLGRASPTPSSATPSTSSLWPVNAWRRAVKPWRRCAATALAASRTAQRVSWEGSRRSPLRSPPPCPRRGLPALPCRHCTCVPGEDAVRIQPTLRKMKASGVRAILDYAAGEWGGHAGPAPRRHGE